MFSVVHIFIGHFAITFAPTQTHKDISDSMTLPNEYCYSDHKGQENERKNRRNRRRKNEWDWIILVWHFVALSRKWLFIFDSKSVGTKCAFSFLLLLLFDRRYSHRIGRRDECLIGRSTRVDEQEQEKEIERQNVFRISKFCDRMQLVS